MKETYEKVGQKYKVHPHHLDDVCVQYESNPTSAPETRMQDRRTNGWLARPTYIWDNIIAPRH